MYQDLKGSKVVIKQRASLMDRQITILEQSKYDDFKAICDDLEGTDIFGTASTTSTLAGRVEYLIER